MVTTVSAPPARDVPWWGRVATATDRTWLAAAVAVAGALAFVVGRLVVAAHGNVGAFLVLGSIHLTGGHAPAGIPVANAPGYDGQFYWRIALDPLDLHRTAFGLKLDTVSRFERIGYPALAWLLAGGRRSLVPDSLVAVNVLALGALGLGGARFARDGGRHALVGLAVPAFSGYLWSAGRDLTEPTAAAFLVLGLFAYRKQRWVPAALLLLGAVLSKESATYVVAVVAAVRLVGWVVRRDRPLLGRPDLVWGVPAVGFVAWQAVVGAATGSVPLLTSGQNNLGTPVLGLVEGPAHYLRHPATTASLLWLGEYVVLVGVAVSAGWYLRGSTVPFHEKVAWGAVTVIALCVSAGIWIDGAGFRSLDDVWLLSWIVLLGSPRRLVLQVSAAAVAWVVVAVELVRAI
jgi:hypothetical protein